MAADFSPPIRYHEKRLPQSVRYSGTVAINSRETVGQISDADAAVRAKTEKRCNDDDSINSSVKSRSDNRRRRLFG